MHPLSGLPRSPNSFSPTNITMEPGSSSAKQAEQPNSSSSKEADGAAYSFLASPSFTGPREGYIFTTGDEGTGFYKDNPLHLRMKAAAAKAKPMLLKSSSIVKGLARKPGQALPDAKKRKTDVESKRPTYLKQMDKYHAMNCSSASGDRPLVK